MTNMIQSQQKRFPLLIVFLASLMYHTNGDMSHVVNVCCEIGTAWSRSNSRCDDYVEAVSDISDDEQVTCQMVIGVCCLKSKQLEMCQVGKNFAILEGQCVVRDNTFAAVTYKECCQCCQMGKITRLMGMSCTTPSIGNPCDLMFMECCIGISAEPNLRNMITDSNCPAGFAYNTVSLKCEDVDECVIDRHNCRGDNEICINRIGSYHCQCDEGYHKNRENDICEDIDECARRMDNCTSSQRCENKMGSYTCRRITQCGTGWTMDKVTQECIDQDECEVDTHNCSTGYECYNMEGSFRCNPRRCPEGSRFSSTADQCEKVDCPAGLRVGSTSLCIDIDECARRDSPCHNHQKCVNTYGSYHCVDTVNCGPGFEVELDGSTCVDIDECKTGAHDCQGGAECINRQGSYICSCPNGYKRERDVCEDKNECLLGNACPSNAVCENTRGSYRCVCARGFYQVGHQQCVDIDECDDRSICSQGCVNHIGSYTCTCESGYKLAPDDRTCVDIDECRLFSNPGICMGKCVNTPGSYMCSCPSGWRILANSRTCQDIDECVEGLDRCGKDEDVMCFNTRGSHRCPRVTCPPGFSRSELGPHRNSDVQVESDSILCRKFCRPYDIQCNHNETTSVSYQFFALPTLPRVEQPVILVNITAQGFILVPQMFLHIISGNEGQLFDTQVVGDTALFRLVRPLIGPMEKRVMLRLENRSYIGNKLLSAHNSHLKIYVSDHEY